MNKNHCFIAVSALSLGLWGYAAFGTSDRAVKTALFGLSSAGAVTVAWLNKGKESVSEQVPAVQGYTSPENPRAELADLDSLLSQSNPQISQIKPQKTGHNLVQFEPEELQNYLKEFQALRQNI